MTITRSEVLANREKWVNFLMVKGRKKAKFVLDSTQSARCCLGHGAYVLNVKRFKGNGDFTYGEEGENAAAPEELVELVGLWDQDGSCGNQHLKININDVDFLSLTEVNDGYTYEYSRIPTEHDGLSPRQIGTYLKSVIEGGTNTLFKPLTDYPS